MEISMSGIRKLSQQNLYLSAKPFLYVRSSLSCTLSNWLWNWFFEFIEYCVWIFLHSKDKYLIFWQILEFRFSVLIFALLSAETPYFHIQKYQRPNRWIFSGSIWGTAHVNVKFRLHLVNNIIRSWIIFFLNF